MMKNNVYIEKKINILKSELKLIFDDNTKKITLTSGPISKEDAIELKIFQLNLIKHIRKNTITAKDLNQEFQNKFSLLCNNCKKGFEKQERECDNDLQNFVACWMLEKSLVN